MMRISNAVLVNMDSWMDAIREIEAHAIPGNKVRCLALLRNMTQCQISLRRLISRHTGETIP